MPHLLLKDLPRYECLMEAARDFPDLDPSAVEVFLHLLRTGDEAFGVTESHLVAHGIAQGRFSVLMLLWRNTQSRLQEAACEQCGDDGPQTPAKLAEAAGVTRATMTGLIDTLERDGLVKRQPATHDRRMMTVNLTAKGSKLLHSLLPGHFKSIARLMSPLTENERKTLVRLLAKVQQQAARGGSRAQT